MSETVELQNYLDNVFGSDVKQLHNVEKIYSQALSTKQSLQLQLSVIQNEVPSKIKAAVSSANEYLDKVEEFHLAKSTVNSELSVCIQNGAPAIERFEQSIRKVNEIKKYISYMNWIAKIEETSDGVQRSILSDSMNDACFTFQKLLQFHSNLLENSTRCSNLLSFLRNTTIFWYNILKEKLAKELDVVLKQISWPFITGPGPHTLQKVVANTDKPSSTTSFAEQDPASHLEFVVANLLLIHLPPGFEDESSGKSLMAAESKSTGENTEKKPIFLEPTKGQNVVLLPLRLLLQPLKKRFCFHFTGNKQTNDINKPEWYLTQVINWISHHAEFLDHTIQPILDKHNHAHVDALMMFTQGLLQLVTAKLSNDVTEIMYSDDLFSHTVDEVLLFEKVLRVNYNISDYLLKTNGPMTVLAHPDCIRKWLNIERTCAVDRLDALLSSENAWKPPLLAVDENDEMKVPECAEVFITMLLTITDRYKNLPSYNDQLQFLDLQLLLLDDFRIRLTQVMRSLTSSQYDDVSISILNAAFYITVVLREWADNVFFLQLKYCKDKENNATGTSSPVVPKSFLQLGESNMVSLSHQSTDETVFDSIVNLYDRIYLEGLDSIAQTIMAEYKEKSQPYLYDQWITLPLPEEQIIFVVSRSACPMLEVLQERLYSFEQKLGCTLFTKLWQCIAKNVDKYLYEEVVLKNYFNIGGASQLQYDMTHNLYPLFSPYTNKPENYFKRMKESCQLLNLQVGNAMLLREAISDSMETDNPFDKIVPKSDPAKILTEMNVTLLNPDEVAKILKRRIEWKTL